jgi:hypothetical protein
MYCPQCGSEASPGLRYCRSCGLALSAVEAALDARLSAAAAQLQHSARAIKFGLIWMALFVLMAVIAGASSGPFEMTIGPLLIGVSDWGVSLILALLLGIPAVGLGYRRLRQAAEQFQALNNPGDAGGRRAPQLDDGSARTLVGDKETGRILEVGAGSEDATARLKQTRGTDQ